MKLLSKAIAVAVAAMAVTGVAEAKIATVAQATTFDGSEMVFSVWNPVLKQSYALDLGLKQSSFLLDTTVSRSWTVNDLNFNDFWNATSATGGSRYQVVSGSNSLSSSTTVINAPGTDTHGMTKKAASLKNYGLIVTGDAVHTLADFTAATSSTGGQALTTTVGYFQNVDNGSGQASGDVSTNASMYAVDNNAAGYFETAWGTNLDQKLGSFNSTALVGTDADFFWFKKNATGSANEFVQLASWNFSVANNVGTLTYSPAPAAVPLPAAVWMFGAGLMGVLRATRRKSAVV